AFACALAHGPLTGWRPLAQPWIALVAAAAMVPLYLGAVAQAKVWGDVVKAAFDCYLPDLVKQLGYAGPKTPAEAKALWGELNALFVYRQSVDPLKAPLAGAVPPPHDNGLAGLLKSLLGHKP
ncbi:MAG TPA: hypothetical protein VG939_20990, partial [Caulobacteraceae bacterium]|nr:hypothetical protein [Caulobacteraceae bacterium]